MTNEAHDTEALLTQPEQQRLRDGFFRWQCRIRQISVRKANARPTSGMVPTVRVPGTSDGASRLTVLIMKNDPAVTDQFRFYYQKTLEPAERFDNAVKYMSAAYYQQPESFRKELSALCSGTHAVADKLLQARECVLEFEQYNQSFRIPCRVHAALQGDAIYEATYWHNILFNPGLPPDIRVLVFKPMWDRASAHPAVT